MYVPGINGIDEIQVRSGTNGLEIGMKMPLTTDHTRRKTGGCPSDVDRPVLIGANDRLRGHATVLMLHGCDGSSKKSWREGGFERQRNLEIKTKALSGYSIPDRAAFSPL